MTPLTYPDGSEHLSFDRRCGLGRIAGSAAFVATLSSRRAAAAEPAVETAYGKVKGANSNGIHIFKSVRYGAPTGGASRFMPPKKPAPGLAFATPFITATARFSEPSRDLSLPFRLAVAGHGRQA